MNMMLSSEIVRTAIIGEISSSKAGKMLVSNGNFRVIVNTRDGTTKP